MIRSLITLVALAAAVALFFLYTKPTYDGMQLQKAKIAEYDRALDNVSKLQYLKQTLLSRFNAFPQESKTRLEKLLPDHVDNVRLVLDLDTLASKHEFELQNLAISTPTKGADSINVDSIETDPTRYDSLTLSFATTGTYKGFVTFLTELEKSLRIVDVESLKIATGGEAGVEPTYRFDITLRTYWLK